MKTISELIIEYWQEMLSKAKKDKNSKLIESLTKLLKDKGDKK